MMLSHKIKSILIIFIVLILTAAAVTTIINVYVCSHVSKNIVTAEEAAKEENCVVVLGAGVRNGEPTPMLRDRLDKAIEIYNLTENGCTLLMSGNGGADGTEDEVTTMRAYAIEKGVKEEDIIVDPWGLSTYESMYRTINEFGYSKFTVVTQMYHLSRSLYSAEKLGADVIGVPALEVRYSGQTIRDIREILARVKDFGLAQIKYDI
jgi:SanA protein